MRQLQMKLRTCSNHFHFSGAFHKLRLDIKMQGALCTVVDDSAKHIIFSKILMVWQCGHLCGQSVMNCAGFCNWFKWTETPPLNSLSNLRTVSTPMDKLTSDIMKTNFIVKHDASPYWQVISDNQTVFRNILCKKPSSSYFES